MSDKKETRGRRKLTLEDLPPSWKQDINMLGENGKTKTHVCMLLGISKNTLVRLEADHDEIREAMENFEIATQCYWMDVGQELSTGVGVSAGGNSNAWKFNMQNRTGWTDKVSTEQKTTIQVEDSAADLFNSLIESSKRDGIEQKD